MNGELLYDILIVVAWVGLWGMTEIIIDKIAKDNANLRFCVYVLITILAILIIFIIDQQPPENPLH